MLILHTIPVLTLSGPQRGTAELCGRLIRRGFPCAALSLSGDGPGRVYYEDHGVPIHTIDGQGMSRPLLGLKIARLARKLGATALHGHPDRVPLWVARLLTGLPTFMTLHRYGFDGAVIRRVMKLTSLFISGYVGVSRRVCDYLIEEDGIHPSRVFLIPNGLDLERFHPGAISREAARRQFNIAQGRKVIGYVGRLGHRKGLHHLIRATAEIDGLLCLLAGGGYFEPELRQLAQSLGLGEDRVRFVGRVSDPRPVYAACDIAVTMGRGESFNRGFAEPLALGVPAVALGQGGVPEVIPPDCYELLIREYSTAALVDKLHRLFNNPEQTERLTRRAGDYIRESFNLEQMANASERLYRRTLIEGKRPSPPWRGRKAPRLSGAHDPRHSPAWLPEEQALTTRDLGQDPHNLPA